VWFTNYWAGMEIIRYNPSAPAGQQFLRLPLAEPQGASPKLVPFAWPVDLKFTGASQLVLPERPPRAEDAALSPFGEPKGAAPPAMTTLAEGSGTSVWRHDLATDSAELATEHDSGMERFDAIGIAAGLKISERYRIAADDPLSANAALAWTIRRERGDWCVRVEARIELSSTADDFLVRQSLNAFEGESSVFAQHWERRIPRDLV